MTAFFLWSLLILLLLLLSAFCSASESSLLSLSSSQTKAYGSSSDPKKLLIAKLLSEPQDLMITLLMLNITANIGVQNVIATATDDDSNWFVTVGLPLILTLMLGDILPKTFAMINNQKVAPFIAPFINYPHRLLYPLRNFLLALIRPISKHLFFFLRPEASISKEELHHILSTSENDGVLQRSEAALISGCLDLQELRVKDRMQTRSDIVWYDIEDPLENLEDVFCKLECSRVPICRGQLDNVLGILSAKIYFLHRPEIKSGNDLTPYLDAPFFIPASAHTNYLMHQFYRSSQEMALVVDEFGDLIGLATIEDLIEVVIGEIYDKRDMQRDYIHSGKDAIVAHGKLTLQEFESIFKIALTDSKSVTTLAGWLITEFKGIPPSGAKMTTDTFFFHILESEPNRIIRIYVRKIPTNQDAGG